MRGDRSAVHDASGLQHNAHLENYARLEYLHALDIGQDTDFEKVARLFPKAEVNCILFPAWIESHSMDEIRAELLRLMDLGNVFRRFPSLCWRSTSN